MTEFGAAPGWFRRHFTEDYRLLYRGRDQAQADAEAACIARELAIRPGERVLDLCCGYGRHLAAFARRGIRATGADLSLTLLKQVEPARERRVVCADMRALPFPGGSRGFDAVVNFFTSFGYFETDEENAEAAREMARVLRPGGRLAMDLMNPGPAVRGLEPRTERRARGFHVVEERRHDPARKRIEKRIELRCDATGDVRRYLESVRVFSPGEIRALLEDAGLRVEGMLGDFEGSPCGEDSPRMIVLGRKPR
ncbi:MAG: methyltransferase domain-containing protein [Planctomycetes bacterium]|nr:methyltransferase domain-containing protein [Planctomycetota bacterium]